MRPISTVFYKRDFSQPLSFPAVKLIPDTYSHAAIGGPHKARVRAYGQAAALWDMLEWLRAPVELIDWRAERVWWGWLAGATVKVGAVEIGLTLDAMSNRVAVAYTGQGGLTGRYTTAWAQDDQSVTAYGTKELLASLSNASQASAENYRDSLIGELRYPVPQINFRAGGDMSAVLEFRGWFETLGWVYYSQPSGLEAYTDIGSASQAIGDASARQQLAQSFTLDAAWNAQMVAFSLKAVGSPADDVIIEICSDSAGSPGGVLGTATIPAASVTTSTAWVWGTLASVVSLAASTLYWLKIRRSGTVDGSNYYSITVNEALGYADGSFKVYNGSAWSSRSPDADANFQVAGVQETTTQIGDMVTGAGQFLTGTVVEDASGVQSPQYRDGDTTALTEVEALLRAGTTNGRRMLAQVTPDRTLRLYEEPEFSASAPQYLINSQGRLFDRWGNPTLDHTCPVGGWCQLKDVIPPTLDTSKMADATRFFIERSEYDVASMKLSVEARSVRSVFDFGIGEG